MESSKLAGMGGNTAEIIHEISQPLVGITILAKLTLDESKEMELEETDSNIEENLQTIISHSNEGKQLVQEMRKRAAQNRIEPKPEDLMR